MIDGFVDVIPYRGVLLCGHIAGTSLAGRHSAGPKLCRLGCSTGL